MKLTTFTDTTQGNASKHTLINIPAASLLGIPKELRFQIFEELFPTTTTFPLKERTASDHDWQNLKKRRWPQILRTNRQMYEEGSSVLYSRTKFIVMVHKGAIKFHNRNFLVPSEEHSTREDLARQLSHFKSIDLTVEAIDSKSDGAYSLHYRSLKKNLDSFVDCLRRFGCLKRLHVKIDVPPIYVQCWDGSMDTKRKDVEA
ncbi:hypothetical protein EJ08DRAFT_143098 [Tothia fuscella]|uniref:F-box domain-containing protein n=1 Tax=Tothia fuscella TaxID=1048955 RepID=A0A9P4P2S2_9PEZI|nr:hypothetical protein EJ08DRAFT_143098 [Tothia fuscella]